MRQSTMATVFAAGCALSAPVIGDECKGTSELAETIMAGRQAGVLMADMIAKVREDETTDPRDIQQFERIIVAAYDQPRYNTDENRERAAKDFANDWYLTCFKARGKPG